MRMKKEERVQVINLEALASMTDAQKDAMAKQISEERKAAVESVRGRLALGATIPVALAGIGSWVWLVMIALQESGLATDAVGQLFAKIVVAFLLTGILTGVFAGLAFAATYNLMGKRD